MQRKVLVVEGCLQQPNFTTAVNDFDAKKSTRYRRVLAETELVISYPVCLLHKLTS